jgi:hypothetical protein
MRWRHPTTLRAEGQRDVERGRAGPDDASYAEPLRELPAAVVIRCAVATGADPSRPELRSCGALRAELRRARLPGPLPASAEPTSEGPRARPQPLAARGSSRRVTRARRAALSGCRATTTPCQGARFPAAPGPAVPLPGSPPKVPSPRRSPPPTASPRPQAKTRWRRAAGPDWALAPIARRSFPVPGPRSPRGRRARIVAEPRLLAKERAPVWSAE